MLKAIVIREAMQRRSHPPEEMLRPPDAPQTGRRIRVKQILSSCSIERFDSADKYQPSRTARFSPMAHVGGRYAQEKECTALNHLATLTALESYDLKTARNLIEEVLRVAQQSGDERGLAEEEWNLAQMRMYALDVSEALRHGERAWVFSGLS